MERIRSIVVFVVFVHLSIALAAGCGGSGRERGEGEANPMAIRVTSSSFAEGAAIPRKHTGDGEDLSPPLAWSGAPEATVSFALIADDPDAPAGTWVHWVLWGIPSSTPALPEGVPTDELLEGGGRQGKNDFGKVGYGGPAPPRGKPHRYFFKVYALDAAIDLAPGATKSRLLAAMQGHILAEGALMGTYRRE